MTDEGAHSARSALEKLIGYMLVPPGFLVGLWVLDTVPIAHFVASVATKSCVGETRYSVWLAVLVFLGPLLVPIAFLTLRGFLIRSAVIPIIVAVVLATFIVWFEMAAIEADDKAGRRAEMLVKSAFCQNVRTVTRMVFE
jgi:hypothetical protein